VIESPFATVRLRQRVTKGAGSRQKGLLWLSSCWRWQRRVGGESTAHISSRLYGPESSSATAFRRNGEVLPNVEPKPATGQVNRGSILAAFLVAGPLAVSRQPSAVSRQPSAVSRQPIIADIEGGGECQSMEGSDALSALAEVAIGITGFAAIALVLRRSRDALSPDILLVIRTMIVNGVFLAFLALFPWVLASASLPPTEVWRWSSVAFVFGVLSGTLARIERPWNCVRLPHLPPASMSVRCEQPPVCR
jgi:hypothetical protein